VIKQPGVSATEINAMRTEIEQLRAALTKIANDSYTREDERLTSEQPMMIWQLVARAALTSARRAP
jgi:hypothetical protein